MVEYRNADGSTTRTAEPAYIERRGSSPAMIIGGVLLVALIVIGLLFATGFWSADVKGGALPKVNVNAKGGELPDVDVHSKQVVVGTSKKTVDVPKVETKKVAIDVPTVGVKDGDKK